MSKFVETRELGFTYQARDDSRAIPALCDVSLTVEEGEYVAVLGHNGSGKSTFAKLLNLILQPSQGAVIIDGSTFASTPEPTDEEVFSVRKKVGMVFQNPDNQLVATIVEEDVAFGPENLGLPREEIRRRVDESLDRVGMREYAHHAPHRLSGGQKQRVAIAGILAMKPRCIVLDESTAMLDPLGRKEVMDTIERLNREEGITILHITHHMEEAARADRILVINDGRLFLDGDPREVFSQVDKLKSVGLEVPQSMYLLHLLRNQGLPIAEDALTVEECADVLDRFLQAQGLRGADHV